MNVISGNSCNQLIVTRFMISVIVILNPFFPLKLMMSEGEPPNLGNNRNKKKSSLSLWPRFEIRTYPLAAALFVGNLSTGMMLWLFTCSGVVRRSSVGPPILSFLVPALILVDVHSCLSPRSCSLFPKRPKEPLSLPLFVETTIARRLVPYFNQESLTTYVVACDRMTSLGEIQNCWSRFLSLILSRE